MPLNNLQCHFSEDLFYIHHSFFVKFKSDVIKSLKSRIYHENKGIIIIITEL